MHIAAEQQRLNDAMAGTWLGELHSYPSPWDPKGGVALGRTQARLALGGLSLVSDYAEERDGAITFRGHGVYTWDALHKIYRMYWFDSVQPAPTLVPVTGVWTDTQLVFASKTDVAEHRYVYDFLDSNYYDFHIDLRRSGQDWRTYARGQYARQG